MTALLLGATSQILAAPRWLPYGPDGGDARAFAADPHDHLHLYLGTVNGWIYESHTGGQSWQRLASIGHRDDLALDSIVVDAANPRHLLVGAWVLDHPDGGLYVSNDGGATWTNEPQMKGQSIRALAAAPSDSKIVVAGTLKGVYRSNDSGAHWTRISPEENKEIHEVESIAIDPKDPQTIYAGTWHLPWKTTNGGEKWASIKQGIIDDSDVFSIIIDPLTPQVVYASACSGIYKSDNAGQQFHKVQGIPSTARRTRVLLQDPNHGDTVFAGTTEGLFRSDNAGKDWVRTTSADTIVNDIYIDPKDSRKVMLATNRSGVRASDDGGDNFAPSNTGFSSRQITAWTQSREQPGQVFIGVVNDKEWGGVFESQNGGLNWEQISAGLEGKDVFSLGQTPGGTLLAGTSHGIFHLASGAWVRAGDVKMTPAPAWHPRVNAAGKGSAMAMKKKAPAAPAAPPAGTAVAMKGFDDAVFALATTSDTVYAATTRGVLMSVNDGSSWRLVSGIPAEEWRFLASSRGTVVTASLHAVMRSSDGGRTWNNVTLPPGLTQVGAVSVDDSGAVWVGGREGLYVSDDGGHVWTTLKNLVLSGVNSIFYDQGNNRILFTANTGASTVFTVTLPQRAVSFTDTGWNLRFVRPVGDHYVAATLFDGIVVQPRMVASPIGGGGQ